MRRRMWLATAATVGLTGALTGAFATGSLTAQQAPESILPPGFDDPAPAPSPTPAPRATAAPPSTPGSPAAPSVQPGTVLPGTAPDPGNLPPVPQVSSQELSRLPSLEQLESMSTDELDDLLGLKPRFDIPPAARRSLKQVGVLAPSESGLPTGSLAKQPASLVRAALSGTKGPVVSRWGHILLRRALASRLAAPQGMNPVEFAALRTGVLNRIGEYAVARRLAQDVDTGNWNDALTDEALTAYIAAADFVGACPAVRLQGSRREDAQWAMMQAICNAYAGEGALAASQLNRALSDEIAPPIDILLAQRYAGAAGRGRGAVEIEWDGVEELNPWRFSLANAVGEPVPDDLIEDPAAYYSRSGAITAAVPLAQRLTYAERAARDGVFSSQAMIDLYSQIYADNAITGDSANRARLLREAYVATDPAARIAAMRRLWGTLDGDLDQPDYAASVTTAYAAARITPGADFARYADHLIVSMLSAGLDRDAASWGNAVEVGSLAWALIAAGGSNAGYASEDGVDGFIGNDDSDESRKSAFLVAGLAGLGRLSQGEAAGFADRLDIDISRQTRWSRAISRAADVGNPALVALLAGLGMQGSDWSQMTPLHLYHITSALRRVGLDAEARMIAAEAVARG
ncbi:hypothetical protein [Erythrobacter sp. JK5]|uniref:hypothetical protein n=1 Tax=Erythrobacter sp. JK5 TaxID=2829500 RepID=UPI001BAC7217|nr:hypothetical protein [Erythrobacter sp. JK5]QUL38920.1 hypothetical protein KDC96_06090 [Erythrobacter sp. JK5]